ncbi:Tyrosine aminotransferase [Actinidia chinensis var. chinensis]|uniref:Tyrosine aminotransferase n=1 Tax=Actinidia chinensis var. chinensis TaxID=1590841 RepID=A0A2R6QC34_ACTCC|nr:Tyrosine aminotransferase [Actinidia chinensis var. chinensis]
MDEEKSIKWRFKANEEVSRASAYTIKGVFYTLLKHLSDSGDDRPVISLGRGDPSASPCFRTTPVAEDAVVEALQSSDFNSCAPDFGILPARRSVAEYLSCDLPYKLSPDDVYLTVGAKQAIEIILPALVRPGANILLPKPGYPLYEAHAALSHLEVRHFDLLPEKGWEVDLDGLKALANDKTIAMVIVNPGNPCGNVFAYEHLEKVSETARELGILVIADEVYDHLAFGNTPFVPMREFAATVPVLTLGSISKRWNVPGWRLGWIVTCDPNGILQNSGIVDCIKHCLNVTSRPTTFVQGAIPQIFAKTTEDFFLNTLNLLREAAETCYDKLKDIPCITCPHKPEGSMFVMVKLNLSLLEGIEDDMEFCIKLVKEESVIILPGVALGLKNWLRITFAIELSSLEDGLARLKAFCSRHSKKH